MKKFLNPAVRKMVALMVLVLARAMFGLPRKLYMVIRVILENYRANAGYEFYENYGLEFSYSQPL